MKIKRGRLTAFVLTIAMILTMVIVPVNAAQSNEVVNVAADAVKSWDFTIAQDASWQQGTDIPSDTYEGLTLTNVKYHGTEYGTSMGNGSSIDIAVDGPCNIKVYVGYQWNLGLKGDEFTEFSPSDSQKEWITFYYKGEAGTATVEAYGTSYVGKIEIGEATDPTPAMQLDTTPIELKMDGTTSAQLTPSLRATTGADVSVVSNDEAVATATIDAETTIITITAVGQGDTTVDVSLISNPKQAFSVKVHVDPAGELDMTLKEGTYNFATTDTSSASVRGITWNDLAHNGNNHGVEGSLPATIVLNLKTDVTADITVTTCCFGSGELVRMKTDSGSVISSTTWNESGKNGMQFIVTGAKGETTLTFDTEAGGGSIWIHEITVKYDAPVSDVKQIDVWDIAGQTVTGDGYVNNITPQAWVDSTAVENGIFKELGDTKFGDLSINHTANDRLYSNIDGGADFAAVVGSNNTNNYVYDFGDGYTSSGGVYCNGTGGSSRRYIMIDRVNPGDKIVAYMGSAQNGDIAFHFDGQGAAVEQQETTESVKVSTYEKFEFVAQYKGSYKIWAGTEGGGKAFYQRFIRVPGVAVSGKITFPQDFSSTDYKVKFINKTNRQETFADIAEDGSYTVTLAAGYEYSAMLTGAPGFGFDNETKTVATTDEESLTGKSDVNLNVVTKVTYTYSGSVKGFADGYDTSKLQIKLTPEADSGSDEVYLTINDDMTFTVSLDPDVKYTPTMTGVNDYVIKSPEVINNSGDTREDIVVELKPMYTASGKFLGLPEGTAVTALSFENVEDGYTYDADISDGGYSISLRDGAYTSKATVDGYSTITHVVVSGADVVKDLLFVSTSSEKPAVDWVSDIYVGYSDKENNYNTVNAAVDAVSRMGITDDSKRVTVHIAPGTYREQVIINTPYITFTNDEPDKEVLLTWYYGIGYKYYSSNGYYDPQRAYDKYEKKIAERWGTAVRVLGKGFRAENITFENSFNRYITDEEIEDGAEPSGTEQINITRNYATDVESKAATERAAAICIEADECEFYNCGFYSSQDTVYTNGRIYFKNCLIEGQTDYIFGDVNSKCVFDGCELSWKGYSTGSQGGYVTALRSNKGEPGYVFRNCVISGNDKLTVSPGNFGRPWGPDANVKFLNTKLETSDLIADAGWSDMSGAKPEDAQFGEYGTTSLDGKEVDTSKRVTGTVMTPDAAGAIKPSDYFGEWTPYYYVEEAADIAFATDPYITDNGDINIPYPGHTLTANYSLGDANDANDASIIKWYRVAADGSETLLKTSTAAIDKTYKITSDDVGSNIKVEIIPGTFSGNTGASKTAVVAETVKEGYEDPSGGGNAELGDGINIFLAGDSTVKDYSAKGMYQNGKVSNEGSWGEFLQNFFDSDKVTIVNYAQGGRSSRSFINEGKLDDIAGNISEGDYLFIQFGHNDSANDDSYREDRYAPLGTPDASGVYPVTAPSDLEAESYTWDCGGTYKWYLKQYVDVAKAAGAIPVLVTPVARMYYTSDGTIRPHHDPSLVPGTETTTKQKNDNKTNSYCTAVKQLAEEEDTLLIDGFEITKKIFEDAYQAANSDSYGKQIMSNGDSTHNNKLGGIIEAAAFATAIQDMDLNISKAVQAPTRVQGETPDGVPVFVIDKDGKLTAYDILTECTETAPYWMGKGQEMLDSIAAKAQAPEPSESTEPTESSAPTETATPEPVESSGPEETSTPEPGESSAPAETATPAPEETSAPEPGESSAPAETATPAPEETPTPEPGGETPAPVETATPAPEETPTPEPGEETPAPVETATPAPSATPQPLDDQKFDGASPDNVVITLPESVDEVSAIMINGIVVPKEAYTVENGVITFTPEYLETLPNGANDVIIEVAPGVTYSLTIDVTNTFEATPAPEVSEAPSSPTPTPTRRPSTGGGGALFDSNFSTGGTSAVTPRPAATAEPEASGEPEAPTTAPAEIPTTAPVQGSSQIFEDVPADHWAYAYIMDLYNSGIINGETATLFAPDDQITRAEFTKMAVILFGITPGGETTFTDVAPTDWYAPYVAAGQAEGIINGTTSTTFSPNDNITREQIAAIVGRRLDLSSTWSMSYSDVAEIEEYAQPYVAALSELGILTGSDGMFKPKDPATRAEAAAIMSRVKNR